MATTRLTSTSYVVLGTLDWLGPSTPYRLKRVLADSVEDFFPVPHTSLYAEPARLSAAGLLDEHQEEGSRRRRTYSLNARGREALEAWLATPETDHAEFRLPGVLKLFFGAHPEGYAAEQARHHRALAEKFEAARDLIAARRIETPAGRALALETGIRVHRWWCETWEEIGRRAADWPG
jgi:PadR family transcriptional regulator, regulatory protein AphA